jgi:hypothetical protein
LHAPQHPHECTAVENRVPIANNQIEEQKLKSCESQSHFEEAPRCEKFGLGPYLRLKIVTNVRVLQRVLASHVLSEAALW